MPNIPSCKVLVHSEREERLRIAAVKAVARKRTHDTILILALSVYLEHGDRMPRYSSIDLQPRRFGPRLDWDAHLSGFSASEFKTVDVPTLARHVR